MKRLPILTPKIIIVKDECAQKVHYLPDIGGKLLLNLDFY